MCLTCYQHTRKIWYLQEEAYDIRSGKFLKILPGRIREHWYNFYGARLQQMVDNATYDIAADVNRKPYTGLKKAFYNFFARNFLGGQVASSVDEMLQVLDNAEDVYLHYCSCKKGATGEVDQRCIFINHLARYQQKRHVDGMGRFIDEDEAKELILERRKQGHYGTILWGMRPKIDSICNCDQNCAGLYTPEIRWGLLPSLKISNVINSDRCDEDCSVCLTTCYSKAIVKEKGQKVTKVDQEKCIGCNLCVERCPYGVFESTPRKIYYDAAIGKKVELEEIESFS
ncbi:MAG: 4Fe-4S binding protein [Candidatus Hermodarchaeota archaeon]